MTSNRIEWVAQEMAAHEKVLWLDISEDERDRWRRYARSAIIALDKKPENY